MFFLLYYRGHQEAILSAVYSRVSGVVTMYDVYSMMVCHMTHGISMINAVDAEYIMQLDAADEWMRIYVCSVSDDKDEDE